MIMIDPLGRDVTLDSLEPNSPEILIPKKNVIIDATVFTSLMACARLTDFRYNLHLIPLHGKSKSLEMGSIVHVFLEHYYKAIISGQKKQDAAGYAYTAAYAYSRGPEVVNTPEPDRDWALKTCEQYLDYYKNDFWVPLEIECVKGEVVYEDDEVRVLWKAKYDAIFDTNQGIYPVDHKSMSQNRDTVSLNNQFMGQCLLLKTRMMFVNKVGFQKSLEPKDRFKRVTINYTADRLIEQQSVTIPYHVKLMLMYQETGHWPPNYTHCENKYGFCAFREVCEADRNMREEVLGQQFVVGEVWDINNE